MGLSFCYDVFNIKEIVGKKIISINFNGATGHEERAPGTGAMHIRTPGAGCPALARGRPEGHWRLGGSNAHGRSQHHLTFGSWQRPDWLWQPQHHVALGQHKRQVFASHCYYNIIIYNKNINIIPQLIIFLVFKLLIINKIIIFITQIILFFIWIF